MKIACQADLSFLAAHGDCTFYNELEAIKNCGNNGYLISYGGKYCRKFGDNYANFNEDVGYGYFNMLKILTSPNSINFKIELNS